VKLVHEGTRRTEIAFRPLRAEDLPLLRSWLSEGLPLQWYAGGSAPTEEAVLAKYLPRIAGDERVHCWIMTCDGADAGFFQDYLLAEVPGHPAGEIAPGFAGIDFFLAPSFIGGGLAPRTLQAFAEDVLRRQPNAMGCCADPDPRNDRSVRALRRAGFREIPGDDPSRHPQALLLHTLRPAQDEPSG
jgi:aminoglycoside 6'-N-acetyltransferase